MTSTDEGSLINSILFVILKDWSAVSYGIVTFFAQRYYAKSAIEQNGPAHSPKLQDVSALESLPPVCIASSKFSRCSMPWKSLVIDAVPERNLPEQLARTWRVWDGLHEYWGSWTCMTAECLAKDPQYILAQEQPALLPDPVLLHFSPHLSPVREDVHLFKNFKR